MAPPGAKPAQRGAAPLAIVGIGASAGGLEAFTHLLGHLPGDSGMAFVFVPHLPPGHASMMPEILARSSKMRVREAQNGMPIEANHVYVIPPAQTLETRGGDLFLKPREEGRHHPIDVFFDSLATDQTHRAIGVVLSGSATDGTLGLSAIKAVGGITFAQDSSAQHDAMPRSAIASGVVDFILPPAHIAAELVRVGSHPYVNGGGAAEGASDHEVDPILNQVRKVSGVDFTQYKSNTLHRRIRRRMALVKMRDFDEYARYLRENPKEVEALYQDILIGVTNFFRNPEAFEALKSRVFPRFFKDRSREDPIRVWVLGCSSGEEPYSIAIALTEYASEIHSNVPITIYATDLNNAGVEKSRTGLYPRSIEQDVSPDRLRRFFVEADGGYRVTKSIRDICIFARHNVLADPPFSRMDLISCRNVMIYMEPALQRKLMPILHYALKPGAFLFLGPSETIGSNRELFEAEDSKFKIYSKKSVALRLDQSFPLAPYPNSQRERRGEPPREPVRDPQSDLQREADRVLAARYVPAGVLINSELDVLQFRGETGLYLSPAPGKASLNLLKMAREGLLVALRSLLQRAKRDELVVHESGVRVKSNGGYHEIDLTIMPVGRSTAHDRCFWVLFEEPVAPTRPAASTASKPESRSVARERRQEKAQEKDQEKDQQIVRLTQELAATRDYLQSVIEQQEAANEELQSANEEVQSANEELQSINEELETSKEEIQSSNEELTTVNEELQNRNEELNRVNNDLNNIFSGVQMAIVMVWPDLRIRRFTPMAEKLFNLIAADIGRPIGDIQLSLNIQSLPHLLAEVIDTVAVKEQEVQDKHGRWYLLRIRPYRTLDNKIDGAVIVLVDIDTLKQNQDVLQRHARMLEQTHDAVLIREASGAVVYWNHGAELLYGYTKAEAQRRTSTELLGGNDAQRKGVEIALAAKGEWQGELAQRTRDGREIIVASKQVLFKEGDRTLILDTARDVTERRHLEENLRARIDELAAADRHKNEFLAMLAHELRNPMAPLRNAIQIIGRTAQDTEAFHSARDILTRQVGTLTRLVDDLLDAAHISRGQVRLRKETVELQQVLGRAVESTKPAFESRNHDLQLELPAEPVLLDGDPLRLEQVFANLLGNAAKYSPDLSQIRVTLAVQEQHASSTRSYAVVRVRDSGIGIAPEMISRVFDLFMQADHSLARSSGGLGIGLSLVRSLVELHGGGVEAFSAGLGRGSEFTVYLPLPAQPLSSPTADSEKAQSTPLPVSGQHNARGTRVLVVDDSADIAESTATLLALAGYEVRTANNGLEALEVAERFQPGAIVLDIGMPGLDGFEVARRLRERASGSATLLVAVTGYGTDADRHRAHAAGIDHYLLKPIEVEALEQVLSGVPH